MKKSFNETELYNGKSTVTNYISDVIKGLQTRWEINDGDKISKHSQICEIFWQMYNTLGGNIKNFLEVKGCIDDFVELMEGQFNAEEFKEAKANNWNGGNWQ